MPIEAIGYDSFGATLYGHQITPTYECADCGTRYPSPSAANACCDRRYDRGYD